MTLYLIGTGLNTIEDISVRAKSICENADIIYLEGYTSVFNSSIEQIQEFLGKEIQQASRSKIESEGDAIVESAKSNSVVILVIGDPLSATTHQDIILRTQEAEVEVQVLHNTSIMTAVADAGLDLYKFGRTVTLPFFTENYKPTSPYDGISENLKRGLHTLVLLDIQAEGLIARPDAGQPVAGDGNSRFMTVNQAVDQLLSIELKNAISSLPFVIGCARLGTPDAKIVAAKATTINDVDFGAPLHSLIIPGDLSDVEQQAINRFLISE